ncbi:type 2 lanthipeptide synthetase LanM [Enterobacter cloacae]
MTEKSTTIKTLKKNYANFNESINQVMGIDYDSFDFKSEIIAPHSHYKRLSAISEINIHSKDGVYIYKTLLSNVREELKNEINKTLLEYKELIRHPEDILNKLIDQIIGKLPPVVKILCLFHAQVPSKAAQCKLLEAYPLLASSLDEYIHHCLLLIEVFFFRLLKDQDAIKCILNVETLNLTNLNIGMGDYHEVGHGVIHCDFYDKSLIYKTRSGSNEKLALEIINIIKNDCHNCIPGIPEVLDYVDHSWHFHIQFEDSKTIDDVKEYYRRSGASIAFFYATGGVDFHYENIICHNKIPYFIDLECLFSGPVRLNELSDSILSTYILPVLCGSPTERYNCGLGLRDSGEGHSYDSTFTLNGEGIKKQIPNYYNRPVSLIHNIPGEELKDEIIYGFKIMVNALKRNSSTILNIIASKDSLHGRILLRPTKFYSDIIALSAHPRYSSIPFYRDCFIACALSQNEIPLDVIKYEYNALKNWRIPAFYTDIINKRCYAKDKQDIRFDERFNNLKNLIDNFLSFTSTETDMKYHLAMLNSSINFLFSEHYKSRKIEIKPGAGNITDVMLSGGMHFKGKLLHLNFIKNERYQNTCRVMDMDSSLYHGIGGALFMSLVNYLHTPDIIKKNKITELYSLCCAKIKKENTIGFGAFEHTGSMLYINYLLFKYLKCKSYLSSFIEVLDLILKKNKDTTWSIDIINGVSGLLIVCCRMYHLVPSSSIINAISYFCDVIIHSAIAVNGDKNIISWGNKLTGFAHGNSGVVYALLLANEILKRQEIEFLAFNALRFEHSCKIKSGWKDMRNPAKDTDFNSWCHGSPGIFLSRVAMLKDCPSIMIKTNNLINEDISHYHTSKIFRKANTELSLCHGIFGNSIIDSESCEFNIELDESLVERSLMSGKTGAAYANIYLSHIENDFPNILLLK